MSPKNLGQTKRRGLLVKYSIELVSYFLLNLITIRSRNLLLPLANPNTSEITTNQSSTVSSFIS